MTPKQKQRKELLSLRRALPAAYRASAARAITECVKKNALFCESRLILAYYPVREEPDLVPLWQAALGPGKTLAFPRCEKHTLRFCIVTSLEELVTDAYGIPAPPSDAPSVTDFTGALCIAPALSVDARGVRLGYGGGYYDRFFAAHPEVLRMVCLYEKMRREVLEAEAFDCCIHTLITELGERKL